jgi:5-methylcytosine-specific restriction protein A
VALVRRGYCEACAKRHGSRARAEAARKPKPWAKWYKSARWQAARAGYLRKHPLCVDPFGEHGVVAVAATDCDHRVAVATAWDGREDGPLSGVSALYWDFATNVQGLCHRCHSRKTAMEDGGFGKTVHRGGVG